MFWDKPLDNALSRLKQNVRAPVKLVLWDGREVEFDKNPRVTVRLKDSRIASTLARPSRQQRLAGRPITCRFYRFWLDFGAIGRRMQCFTPEGESG